MGLMEAQRYPADYDAVIVGAPVYTLQVQTSAVLRNQTFARPQAAFTMPELQMVQDAAVAACDANDGLEDGLINNPRACSLATAHLAMRARRKRSVPQPAAGRCAQHAVQRPARVRWQLGNASDEPRRGSGLGLLQPRQTAAGRMKTPRAAAD